MSEEGQEDEEPEEDSDEEPEGVFIPESNDALLSAINDFPTGGKRTRHRNHTTRKGKRNRTKRYIKIYL